MKTPNREADKNSSKDFSNRVLALSPGSKTILEKLGIWESVWRFQEVNSLQVNLELVLSLYFKFHS